MDKQRDHSCFVSVLSTAFLEWMLLILLLLNVMIQYVGLKFAQFCDLRNPCLLCSRIDRILGNVKEELFGNLICDVHKAEISSLAYCRSHQKLANVNNMCQACLHSLANEKKLSLGRNKSLAAKDWVVYEDDDGFQSKSYEDDPVEAPLLEADTEPGSPGTWICSCCSLSFRNKLCVWVGFSTENGRRKNASEFKALSYPRSHDPDNLHHFGYSKLKVGSDFEVDVPYSDNDEDNCNVIVLGNGFGEEEAASQSSKGEPLVDLPDDVIQDTPNGHNGQGPDKIRSPDPLPSEFRSDFVLTEPLNAKSGTGLGDVSRSSSFGDLARTLNSDINLKTPQIQRDNLPPSMDALRLDLGIEGSLLSPKFAQIISRRSSNKVPEDLKSVQQQVMNAPVPYFSWSDMVSSPRENVQTDECKSSAESTSTVLRNNSKWFSVERNEPASESSYGFAVNKFVGESTIDHLKRQVELDRNSMRILYKELEEERSASTIAANQAMAMITRLQEEKAAMQMEALQCLRMMEEQAEYDQEALQTANELLTQREKEIQDLEAVVENYRMQYGDGPLSEIAPELLGDLQTRESNRINATLDVKSVGSNRSGQTDMMPRDSFLAGSSCLKDPLPDLEDEKVYILQCLKILETKINLSSASNLSPASKKGICMDMSRAEAKQALIPEKANENDINRVNTDQENNLVATRNDQSSDPSGVNESEQPYRNKMTWENSWMGGKTMPEMHHSLSRQNPIALNHDAQSITKEIDKGGRLYFNRETDGKYKILSKESNLVDFVGEISHLNDRLEALEAEKNFLEHTIHSLTKGNDGIEYIQEIAAHLRELRKVTQRQIAI